MKQFTATANDEGCGCPVFFTKRDTGLPTSLLYKSFRNKRVKVNGKRAAPPEDRLRAGDLIELDINDEFSPESAPAKPAKSPAQPPVTVVYEDADIAVLYKPAHLLCHSDRTGDANLVDAFAQYLEQKGEYDPQRAAVQTRNLQPAGPRGTEGLVIAAKACRPAGYERDHPHRSAQKNTTPSRSASPERAVHCLVGHDEKNNKVSIHAHQAQDGHRKQIITDVDVLRTAGRFCIVPHWPGHRPHPPDPSTPGLPWQAGVGRYQIWQPQDEPAHRGKDPGTVCGTAQLCRSRRRIRSTAFPARSSKLKDPQILRQFEALDKAPQKTLPTKQRPRPTAGRGRCLITGTDIPPAR